MDWVWLSLLDCIVQDVGISVELGWVCIESLVGLVKLYKWTRGLVYVNLVSNVETGTEAPSCCVGEIRQCVLNYAESDCVLNRT